MKVNVIRRTIMFGDGTMVHLPLKIMRSDDDAELQKAKALCEQLNRETAAFFQLQLARVVQGGAHMVGLSLAQWLQSFGVLRINHEPVELDFQGGDIVLPPEKRIILS